MRLGLPGALFKAGQGFSRGARGHKYYRRVRKIVNGKLRWVHYYHDEKERKQHMKAVAKEHGHGEHELDELHKLKVDFAADHPELRAARKKLSELTKEYVTERLEWEDSPRIKVSKEALADYHAALIEKYGDEDPDDLHGKSISILRTMEMAFERLPPTIKKHFSGTISELVMAGSNAEDDYLLKNMGVAGYCDWPKDGKSRVVVGHGTSQSVAMGRGAKMKGGLFPVEVLIHEMAHAIHNQLGVVSRGALVEPINKEWKGPTFHDWMHWRNEEGGKNEPKVTGYAETDEFEHWAESFTAALMYPRQLASSSPGAYEWFRGFFGEDHMRPLRTDHAAIDGLKAEANAALKAGNMELVRELNRKIDHNVGVLDMAEDDARLQWWRKPETHVGRTIREEMDRIKQDGDPWSVVYEHPDDKFYEMTANGRTIYWRQGKQSKDDPYSGWSPTSRGHDKKTKGTQIKAGEIKEVYDGDGNPITHDLAFWYLFQDEFPDDHPKAQEITEWKETNDMRMMLDRIARQGAQNFPGKKGTLFTKERAPALIDETQFRLRSGKFAYDRWGPPKSDKTEYKYTGAGYREFEALRRERDPAKRKKLLAEFMRKNPGAVAYQTGPDGKPPRVTQADIDEGLYPQQHKGRMKKRQVLMAAAEPGEEPVPVLNKIRYINDNPDGSKTVVNVVKETRGVNRGYYTIESPVWRQLLTPNGGPVTSASHMEELCRAAAQERRRAWVSIRTDTAGGDTEHYYHLQVEFDGRGQPKIIGDEWKRRLGKDTPRLEDLLTAVGGKVAGVEGIETERARIKAESIRLKKPAKPKRGKARIPKVGQTTILQVENAEVGRRTPDPPGWDRMPPKLDAEGNVIERPPLPKPGKAQALFKEERRLKKLGLLPPWYNGSEEQRKWWGNELDPLIEQWRPHTKRAVQCVLTSIVPEKKAGVVPDPPGWDRMPEGAPGFPEARGDEPKPQGRHPKLPKGMPSLKELKARGLLPASYGKTEAHRTWFFKHFVPAWQRWEETKEEETAKHLPARYVFTAMAGSGFPGRTITRYGDRHVIDTTLDPFTSQTPEALEHDTLVYAHTKVNPVTGKVIERSMRVLLPKDGSVPLEALKGVHGFVIDADVDPETGQRNQYIQVSTDGFDRMRDHLGAVSLTSEAEAMVRAQADLLREAAERQKREEHAIAIEDLDPAKLAAGQVDGFGKVGVVSHMADGNPFELAHHQKELIQLLVDNDGRALGGHYMGTGKTVSAIVMAKLMMAMKDPEDPDKPHPNAPKKTLIVAPLNTVEQWRQSCFDFDEGCHVVGAGRGDIPVDDYIENMKQYGHNIVVVGPEYFTINQDKLRKAGFDGLIVDEAHQGIKNEVSKRNEAISEWNPDMKLLCLLTGTPITVSPVDILEYIKILSKGQQWAGMTRQQFINEYLEESPIPGELGIKGRKGPKVQIKPHKRAELAAIIAQWTHVALPKDVKGKTLPGVRIEESKHAHMTGTQALLYGLAMASMSEADLAKIQGGIAAEDELAGAGKKQVGIAKAIANCPAYKPKSNEQFVMYTRKTADKKGKIKEERTKWRTFDPDWLMKRPDITKPGIRKKLAGRWPSLDTIGPEQALLYERHFRDVLGGTYSELAGTKITEEQLDRMKAAGWPHDVRNPDAGPVGIRCRGRDEPRRDPEYLERVERAVEFQRDYSTMVLEGVWNPEKQRIEKLNPDAALIATAKKHGISNSEALKLLGTHPNDHVHHKEVTYGGVTVEEGRTWYSDTRGSLHLPYREEDFDVDTGLPRSRGGFEVVRDGERVDVLKKYQPKPVRPKGISNDEWKEIQEEWEAPSLRYDEATTEAEGGAHPGQAAIRREDTGEVIWVPKKAVQARVRSLMDPGMREERRKFDVAMVVGNAKAEELRTHIQNFHRTTEDGRIHEDGRHGSRQMVLFANGILDGCRTMESTLRSMGMKDVNEALEGSIEYDPEDPHPGNGKYFVTYIGSTYTGNRELNAEIFKKRKDKLGRDLPESLFVHKTTVGKEWRLFAAGEPHTTIKMSQWTAEAREAIYKQFKIRPPECHWEDSETGKAMFFYGTKKSADLLRQMALIGDPLKMDGWDPDRKEHKGDAAKAIAELERLQTEYEKEVRANSVTDPPLSSKQEHVFNNCDFIICSDAAQVGLNFGNAVEMINFDSLGSPMQEWQRITRSARMLPPAVKKKLLGDVVTRVATDDKGEPLMSGGEPVVEEVRDAYGNKVFDGPFGKLKAMEAAIFKPADRGAPSGLLYGLEIGGSPVAGSDMTRDGKTIKNAHTFTQVLDRVITNARAQAQRAATPQTREAWEAIANKARVARNLGATQAIAVFDELQSTKVPGGTANVIDFGGKLHDDPMAGTYGATTDDNGKVTQIASVSIEEPEAAIRAALDKLGPEDQRLIAQAGFVAPGTDPDNPQVGSLDAVAIYMAIRSQEILEHIENQRAVVSERMRSAAGGKVVQDSDVMNAIIDSLSPGDRAILKHKKYLVNVRRLGVSASVPLMASVKRKVVDEDTGETKTVEEKVFVGYEKQHPIAPEANVRATARARMTAVEKLLSDVQNKTPIRTEMDYETTDAADIANVSRLDEGVEKSMIALGLPLGGLYGR